jgi:hypothetical protein
VREENMNTGMREEEREGKRRMMEHAKGIKGKGSI